MTVCLCETARSTAAAALGECGADRTCIQLHGHACLHVPRTRTSRSGYPRK